MGLRFRLGLRVRLGHDCLSLGLSHDELLANRLRLDDLHRVDLLLLRLDDLHQVVLSHILFDDWLRLDVIDQRELLVLLLKQISERGML